ncbi:hypothetical protein cyc_02968 [Cyclospora cayetanensis]|uniref:Uncharacterized protein n=1 Tax=Cyclospora cayetanensis TaxID=88456 RepID=A0A1D3CWX9_9EIME|nr:hypothetical protein cyc_02968 [Cyclospora cayetanensis]
MRCATLAPLCPPPPQISLLRPSSRRASPRSSEYDPRVPPLAPQGVLLKRLDWLPLGDSFKRFAHSSVPRLEHDCEKHCEESVADVALQEEVQDLKGKDKREEEGEQSRAHGRQYHLHHFSKDAEGQ